MMNDPESLRLEAVASAEAGEIRRMAEVIWPVVYPAIISPDQIRYMLDWMYDPERIRDEIESSRIRYFWLAAQARVGFLSVEAGNPRDIAFLHKCYVLPQYHGKGYGSLALSQLARILAEEGASGVELRVNRNNTSAISFYQKNGFRILREDCAEIGNGYVMDDFVMRLDFAPTGI